MTTITRLTTPFDARSTADDVLAGIDLTGRRAIVTGGASGIGLETARALAGAGAEVTLAVRDLAAGRQAARAPPPPRGPGRRRAGRPRPPRLARQPVAAGPAAGPHRAAHDPDVPRHLER